MLTVPSDRSHVPHQIDEAYEAARIIVHLVLEWGLIPFDPISNEWHPLWDGSKFAIQVIGLPGFKDGKIVLPGDRRNFIVTARYEDDQFLRAFHYNERITIASSGISHQAVVWLLERRRLIPIASLP